MENNLTPTDYSTMDNGALMKLWEARSHANADQTKVMEAELQRRGIAVEKSAGGDGPGMLGDSCIARPYEEKKMLVLGDKMIKAGKTAPELEDEFTRRHGVGSMDLEVLMNKLRKRGNATLFAGILWAVAAVIRIITTYTKWDHHEKTTVWDGVMCVLFPALAILFLWQGLKYRKAFRKTL